MGSRGDDEARSLFAELILIKLKPCDDSPLGFLNPLIYAHADAFNDVTVGSSDGGCVTDYIMTDYG